MRKNIHLRLLSLLFIILLAACSAAPPTEPTSGFTPHSAPLKPTAVKATNGLRDTIEITWDEVEGATSYQIWAIPATEYGASSTATTREESYSTLIARGFSLVDVVTSETSYKLKGESTNSSYVFSIVAMKTEKGTSSTSVLYSEPSDFVEGGTVGEIILSAVATEKNVTLSWNISNLYSVLDNSRYPEPLYSYRISVLKKISSDTEWEEEELSDTDTTEQTYSISSSSLNIDTLYDFKLKMKIYSGESEISTVESSVYSITTDDSFTPGRVENIKATSGKKRGEVTLSWTVPALPKKDDIAPVFRVDRTDDGDNWTTLDTPVSTADGVCSITDTTLEDNTIYTYRIVNGYRIGEKSPVYQSNADAETISSVYSLWMPENITFSFTENDDRMGGVLKVDYDYDAPSGDGKAEFHIGGKTWTENDFTNHTSLDEKEGSVYTVSVASATPLSYFSFYFRFTFDGEEILRVTHEKDVTVGKSSSRDDLISLVKATDDWVGQIRICWTEDSAKLTELGITDKEYAIYEGDTKLDITPVEDGDTRYITIDDAESGVSHTYRIKITVTDGTNTYFGVLEATGKTLTVPVGLTATDSTSTDKIDIRWTPSTTSDVKYTLEYSTDKTTWTELIYVLDGEASLAAKGNGTDGNEYYFRLAALNTEQAGTEALYSEIETGSVFGAYGMNPTVENNGLDPDKITIKWNEVKGAKFYMISRNGEELPQKIRTTEYSDKAESIKNLKTSSTPLSEEYTYTVTPYLDDKTAAVITDASLATVKGKLFASPKNVKATKGEAADSITVTWDSVQYATEYKIEKYSVTLKNGVASYPVLKDTAYTTATTYTEENSSLASSGYVQYVIYSMRTEGEETITSLQQTGAEKTKNSLGFNEENNIGYGLRATSSLTVTSVVNKSTGYYEPYTTVTWSFVPGATSYTLSSSAGSVEINVSDFKYPETGTVNNGKSENEAGYLSYNADSGIYTYNDNSGLLTTPVISKYSLKACNGSAANEKTNATTVYRQPTEEDWISILITILKPAFVKADSYFSGDWFIPDRAFDTKHEDSYTYATTGMTFHLYSKAWNDTYYNDKNYLNIDEYTDSEKELKITTVANIQFSCTNGGEAGYLGTDPLNLIGYNGNGTVSITPLDPKIKSASITLENINVRSVDTGGSYTVTISGNSAKKVTDDAVFVRVL